MENAKKELPATPILFPFDPELFWEHLRILVREELQSAGTFTARETVSHETPGLTYKPLYKISEVCQVFRVSRTTIYDWIRHGKLKPFKVQSRVYFLWNDLQELFRTNRQ